MQDLKYILESNDDIPYEIYLNGLTEQTVRAISADQNEPEWMLEHRLKSLEVFCKLKMPSWGPDLSGLDLEKIVRYARPAKDYK